MPEKKAADTSRVKLMTVDELAAILHSDRRFATKLASSQGFPFLKINNRIYIPEKQFNTWVDRHIGCEYQI